MSATSRRSLGASVHRLALAIALTGLGSVVPVHPAEPAASLAPRVLLINSYSATTGWSVALTAGVREVILAHSLRASLTVEHLADEALAADVVATRLAERLQQEHARERFAVTIVADDAAFEFALAGHERMLPGSPLVFCGVSDLPPDALGAHRAITGTIHIHDVSTVMATALKRHPATRALVVVHDLSPVGRAYREQVQSWTDDIQRRRPGLEVAFLSAAQYSTAELIEQIRVLPVDCLVLLTAWSQDRFAHPEQLDDVLARVARVSPVPVYGVTGSGAGFNTSAARLAEARQQGAAAATVALKILQGVPASEIPIRILRSAPELEAAASIEDDGPSPPALPLTVRLSLIGTPLPRPLFLAVCAVTALLQAALIAMLFLALRRRRQALHALDEAHRRAAQIVDSAELGVLEWDVETGELTCNAHYAERLGYLPDDIEPTRQRWEAMVHPDDLPRVQAAQQECLDDHCTVYAARYRLLTRSGTYRWVLERGEVGARLPDGSPCRLLGILTDAPPSTAPTPG